MTVEHRLYFGEVLGESPAMQRVYAQFAQIAPHDSSVLLTGESGTGKELVARSIHRHSQRATLMGDYRNRMMLGIESDVESTIPM